MNRKLIVAVLWSGWVLASPALEDQNRILDRARDEEHRFREGDLDAAARSVTLLERAVADHPSSSRLWTELGRAYFMEVSMTSVRQGPGPHVIAAMQRAREAYAQALQLDHQNWEALAGHGMSLVTLAHGSERNAAVSQGIQQLDHAVRQDPSNTAIRLLRAFTSVNVPPALRSHANVVEDLNFLIDAAPGGRAEDVLHVLLGDVYAENGDLKSAQREYEWIGGASQLAAGLKDSRLRQLAAGGVPASDMAAVRGVLGSQCTMCHAK